MIGCIHGHNDVYVFFEGDELQKIGTEKVCGDFISFKIRHKGVLEVLVREHDPRGDLTSALLNKNPQGEVIGLDVSIRRDIYETLLERGYCGEHRGYQHISFYDANRLRSTEEFLYQTLKGEQRRQV